ncbi:MAG: DMT family transporter [Hyphomicrobiales bacterium]|nr:DMT family transporter [Hyphomicrobiales bacterium]
MRVSALSPQLVGILSMSAAAFVFSCHDAITKYLAGHYPLGEIIFVRQLSSAVLLLIYIRVVHGFDCLRTNTIKGQSLRAFFFVASTILIALSVTVLPLATALAIVFSSPLLVAALSGPFLAEHVGPRRWMAICAGFVGVLVIIRPTDASFTWLLIIPVVAACASASRDIVTRILQRTDSTYAILFWSNLAVLFATLLSAPFGWISIAPLDIAVLIVAGGLNTLAHFLTITALRHGDAALVTPFRYTALVWAAILGFVIWSDIPDQWTTIGAFIIVSAGTYLVFRETRNRSGGGS